MAKRTGRPKRPRKRAPRYDELERDFVRENEATPPRASRYDLVHLRRFFDGRPGDSIDSALIVKYGLRRQEQQRAAVKTVNHETRDVGWQPASGVSQQKDSAIPGGRISSRRHEDRDCAGRLSQ
jgi:hypothetical protein